MRGKRKKIKFDVISVQPDILTGYLQESIIGRAIRKKIIEVRIHDLRREGEGRRGTVDDRPFGGGPGMVIKFEPIYQLVRRLTRGLKKRRVILFSTRGCKLTGVEARRLARYDQLILICGRYEGVDERVAKYVADEEISIGDYILTGGELPALVTINAVARFLPGVLGREESLEEGRGSYPVYTRPETVVFIDRKTGKKRKAAPPEVLLSGDHQRIEAWRRERGSKS